MDELKAACLALAKEALKPPTTFDANSAIVTQLLENLLRKVVRVREALNPTTAEYVFFPIRSLLQQNYLGTRQTELLFQILTELFTHAWVKSGLELDRAQQLLAVLTFLMSPEPPLSRDAPASSKPSHIEPSKTFLSKPTSFHVAGFDCVNALFTAVANTEINAVIGQSSTTAQILTLLLDGLKYDTDDLRAQIASINALRTILTATITVPDHRALVLPSVASKLIRFIGPSNRRHFSVKVLALTCFVDVVVGSIGDATWDNESTRVRTTEWTATTVAKLQESFTVIKELQQSLLERTGSRPELLVAVYECAQSVYSNCTRTLTSAALETLIEIMLLTTSQQFDAGLASKAKQYLISAEGVSEKLQAGLLAQVNNLSAVLNTPNETKAIASLQSLQNAITLLGSTGFADILIDATESSLPLSIGRPQVSESEPTLRSIESYNATNCHPVRFAELGLNVPLSNGTQHALGRVLTQIGISDPQNTLEVLMDRLESLKLRSKGSLDAVSLLWMAGYALRGAPQETDIHELVAYCYEDLSDALNVHNGAISGAVASAAHTALACYVIGEAALKQGTTFKEYLMDLVHPLFAMLGNSSSPYIREQAGLAISKVAFACGYESPTDLAIDNKDYLVDGMALQLNTLNFTPGTMQALASLIFISGQEILPYLDDVFTSLFVLMDHYHGYSKLVTGILTVFGALVSVIGQPKMLSIEQKPAAKVEISDFAALMAELERKPEVDPTILEKDVDLDKLAAKGNEDSDDDEDREENVADEQTSEARESDEEDIQDEPEDAVEKWEYPIAKPTYTIMHRIVAYCDRLMTHESSEIRLATLILTTMLMPNLAVNKEEFLPLIHKTWPEAVARVSDDEVYVVEQSFACLSAIAQYAEAFVASRIDSIWPRLVKKYAPLLKKKWPHFSPEMRSLTAFSKFFSTIVQHVPDLALQTVETGLVAYRPALLRGDFGNLRSSFQSAKPSLQDLIWLVLLEKPLESEKQELHTIVPMYA